jgi:hypothetical protein
MHGYDDATLDPCKRTRRLTPRESEIFLYATGMLDKEIVLDRFNGEMDFEYEGLEIV